MHMLKFLIAALALAFVIAAPSTLWADPLGFFPSVPLHEDDGLPNEFDLSAVGCAFEITEYRPSRAAPLSLIKTRFELSHYDTDPRLVPAPMPFGRLSSRHTVAWFATDVTDTDIAPVNAPLQDARLSLAERRNTGLATALEKQVRLEDLLALIDAGAFGAFAAQNQTVTYVVEGDDLAITGARVARTVHLPVRRDDGVPLIDALHAYRLANCPEG